MNPETTAADPTPVEPLPGEASPPPLLFTLVIWSGAFSIVLWAMVMLFGRARQRPEPVVEETEDADEQPRG